MFRLILRIVLVFVFVIFSVRLSFSEGLDQYVKLLLHCDNLGNANFVDSSYVGNVVTVNGDVVGVATSKFGLASAYFDMNGDFFTLPAGSNWNFGLEPFTVDFWVYFLNKSFVRMFDHLVSGTLDGWYVYWDPNGFNISLYSNNNSLVVKMEPVLTVDQWYHVALVSDGSLVKWYVDGFQQASAPAVSIQAVDTELGIGAYKNGSYSFSGYLDEVRISKGIARWTTNFTPPVAPYSDATPTPTPTPTSTPDQGTSTAVPTSANVDTGGLSLIISSVLGFFGIVWGIRKLILLLNRS